MDTARNAGFSIIGVQTGHILVIEKLPFFHRDPFDRLLIAQALTDNLQLVSNEVIFDEYGVQRIW